jgi:hypothetical protein
MTGMYTADHSGHTTCGAPGCTSFHLFCPDCGGRRHAGDSLTGTTDSGADGLTGTLELADSPGRDEYRLAGS